MKNKIVTLLTSLLFLTSCGSFDEEYTCRKGKITVLNKEKYPCVRGSGYCGFRIYLYDGTKAEWYSTDENTYNSYNINDTLPTIVLTIIKKEK